METTRLITEEFWKSEESEILHPCFTKVSSCDHIAESVLGELPSHLFFKTSGSSGKPKWVALSKKALLVSAQAVNKHLDIRQGDLWVNPLPLFHVGGMGIVARAFLSQSKVISVVSKWNPEQFVKTLVENGGQWTSMVPTQLVDIIRKKLKPTKSLKGAIIGGGILEDSVKQKALDLGWPVLESYGMSEAGSQIATAVEPGGELLIMDHVEVKISNKLLEWRSASQFSGYVIDGKYVPQDGWVQTNDEVLIEDQKLTFVKRADRIIKILGELVDVDLIEKEINTSSDQQVILIVSPDERRGCLMTPIVESEPSSALAQLLMSYRGIKKLEPLKVELFKRSALGKIQRS